VLADRLHPDGPYPVNGGAEANGFGDLRRAGLKLPRQVCPRRFVGSNGADHVAAAYERRHLLK
jgi:hypothetical protein